MTDEITRRAYRQRVYSRYVSAFKRPGPEPRERTAQRHAPVFDHLLGELIQRVRPAEMLDLGCGPGHLLHWARERGLRAVGVDVSAEQVAEARALGLSAEVALAQEYLERVEGRFDLIVGLDIVEHLDRDEGLDLLDACHRALRPGGWLYLTTPNAAALRPGPVASGDLTHETIYTPDTMRLVLVLSGFEAIEVREIAPPPTSWRSRLRGILWRFVRLVAIVVDVIETGRPASTVFTRVMAVAARRPSSV